MTSPAVSIVIPNLNRKNQLRQTLSRITALNEAATQIIVIDNGSSDGADRMVERTFPNVELIRLGENRGAAGRNLGIRQAKAPITFMLDNDSCPAPGTLERIHEAFAADPRLGVLACRVRLEAGGHEPGGLPGVFIGCGAAMRTDLVKKLGGYPEDFGYYVEEYDLACRVWQSGFSVRWDRHALVHHAKSSDQRDMNRIVYYLVRNNVWLWNRYCPAELRDTVIQRTLRRYKLIAKREHAMQGYYRGLIHAKLSTRRRTGNTQPLSVDQFNALYGAQTAIKMLKQLKINGVERVAIFGWGKGIETIIDLCRRIDLDVPVIIPDRPLPMKRFEAIAVDRKYDPVANSAAVIVGSLSPGGAIDLTVQARNVWTGAQIVSLVKFDESRPRPLPPAASQIGRTVGRGALNGRPLA